MKQSEGLMVRNQVECGETNRTDRLESNGHSHNVLEYENRLIMSSCLCEQTNWKKEVVTHIKKFKSSHVCCIQLIAWDAEWSGFPKVFIMKKI